MGEINFVYLKSLFIELLDIVVREMDIEQDNVKYVIQKIEYGVKLIENSLCNSAGGIFAFNELEQELRKIYQDISVPRVGLQDLFIWRVGVTDRINANKPLESVKNELQLMLG